MTFENKKYLEEDVVSVLVAAKAPVLFPQGNYMRLCVRVESKMES